MQISNNKAIFGGAFFLCLGAAFSLSNTSVCGNRADVGTVVYAHEEDSFIMIYGCKLYNNDNNGDGGYEDAHVVQLFDFSTLDLRYSTIADNDINASSTIIGNRQAHIGIRNSIIYNDETVLEGNDVVFPMTASCLIVNENYSISGPNIYVQEPGFVDANNQNYHINSNPPAIDLCDSTSSGGYGNDSDENPRVWDDPSIVNVEGSLDAGADEYFVDNIFKNSFE